MFKEKIMKKSNINNRSIVNVLRAFSMFAVVLMVASSTFGQVSLTSQGTAVTQNFDTLGTTATSNLTDNITTGLTGVYAFRAVGNAVPNVFTADNGGSNAGRFNNYGTTAATDRAIGSASSGTPGTLNYGVRFKNNTGVPITSLQVTYTGEQWRNGGNTTAQVLAFDYQQAATVTSLTAGTFTPVAALNFTSLVNTATAAALDGNLPANRTTLTSTITVTIPAGEEIMLRWTDLNDAGNDHGFGVDDLSVTPFGAVLDITTANSLTNAQEMMAYTNTLVSAGGVGPYTYAVTAGTLPAGLTLNTDGTWMGMPNTGTAATYNFDVTVTDSNPFSFAKGQSSFAPNTKTESFSLIVVAPSAAPANVSGRLISTSARGLANANVSIRNLSTGEIKQTRSNQRGYFKFLDMEVGNTYVIEVQSKRFVFNNYTFTLNEDLTDLVLTAQ
jgi:hypothetical protein